MGNKSSKNKKDCFMTMQVGNRQSVQVIIRLFDEQCPKTCQNFRKLCQTKYGGTNFHRCTENFIAQGGDYERGDGTGGTSIWGKYFKDENFIIKHDKRGIVSMANRGPNTNGSQFFFTLTECSQLDGKHVAFGEIISGFEILDQISSISTYGGDPKELVKILASGVCQ
ncbi:unnamed protein product [Paramecium sonneborni]|uniref:peptidylprolyl isomerase n=1 Tax=Paramecium sonneborni TaxID=65129 RepID=A0A8S1QE76_9CILI|nr:unnamed protein product [Paramecium sonneborni]